MKYAVAFGLAALALVLAAAEHGGIALLLLWPAVSFGLVAAGYAWLGPRVFGKSPNGRLAISSSILLLPYLLFAWSVWHALRLVRREDAQTRLTDGIVIGRRLLSGELPDDIDNVVDLTCEFNEPRALRALNYRCLPILDAAAPSPDALRRWAGEVAALPGTTYIHCAEGHGRTGLLAAAVLLETGHSRTVEAALDSIRAKRPRVRLGKRQLSVLRKSRRATE